MGSVERVPTGSAPLDRLSHRAVPRILGRCLGSRPSNVNVGLRYAPNRTPRLTDPIDLPETGDIDTRIGVGHG